MNRLWLISNWTVGEPVVCAAAKYVWLSTRGHMTNVIPSLFLECFQSYTMFPELIAWFSPAACCSSPHIHLHPATSKRHWVSFQRASACRMNSEVEAVWQVLFAEAEYDIRQMGPDKLSLGPITAEGCPGCCPPPSSRSHRGSSNLVTTQTTESFRHLRWNTSVSAAGGGFELMSSHVKAWIGLKIGNIIHILSVWNEERETGRKSWDCSNMQLRHLVLCYLARVQFRLPQQRSDVLLLTFDLKGAVYSQCLMSFRRRVKMKSIMNWPIGYLCSMPMPRPCWRL